MSEPPVIWGGYAFPHGFAWKWTFCEEWQILGGIAEREADLGKCASLLYESHSKDDPREMARSEWANLQTPSAE